MGLLGTVDNGLATLSLLGAFIGMGIVALGTTLSILRPLSLRTASETPTRFTVSDIACLMVYLSLLGNVTSTYRAAFQGSFVLLGILMAVAIFELVGLWWLGVRHLSANGVIGTWRRAMFQLFAAPLAVFGPVTVVILGLFAASVALSNDNRRIPGLWTALTWTLIALLVADFWLVRWIAAGSTLGAPSRTRGGIAPASSNLEQPGH